MQMHPSTNSPSVKTRPPSITRNSATAIAGIAASSRAPRSERSRRGAPLLERVPRAPRARGGRARVAISARSSLAEAPPALGELDERLLQRLAREVRPQLVAKHELRVGRLPQQVVGEPLLAARADDQVGIVHLRRIQAGAELLFGLAVEAAGGVEDLR